MNKKAWKLFGEFFLKTIIVILGIAIVIFAIYFMIQVFGGGKDKPSNTNTGNSSNTSATISTVDLTSEEPASEEPVTEEPTSEEPATVEPISSVGHTIEVLNSTETAGVAKGWQTTLNEAGFNVTQIGNYETEGLTDSRIIVTQEGMGQDLLQYFPTATIVVGTIDSGVEIQIIVGTVDVQQ